MSEQDDARKRADALAEASNPTARFSRAEEIIIRLLRSGGFITNARLADMAQSTIKGRAAGAGTGDPADLTAAEATAILNVFTDLLKGLVPASGGGTTNFLRADGTWASQAVTPQLTFTIGPFFINDLPGTATTQAQLGYFNTASAVSLDNNEIEMGRAGEVVGLIIISDLARTAGNAVAGLNINGSPTAFDGGSAELSVFHLTSNSSFVAYGDGVPFAAGDTLGCGVQTTGWTPTTANVVVWVIVALEPF